MVTSRVLLVTFLLSKRRMLPKHRNFADRRIDSAMLDACICNHLPNYIVVNENFRMRYMQSWLNQVNCELQYGKLSGC